ncbi:6-phosphogluconolactonase-like [Xenia sp. Carnegie-2017]|uniref:6-phosphogluconolactonase-like n=1 Tax=Xenia sp. Carnegie-2017 TaxID=2897299 RepID=UPI001F033B2B|nr:6-phosphogluconolactonase-like [Xenia sp. Carnegie-2017]
MVDVQIFSTKTELQTSTGKFIAKKAREAILDHGYFSIAFSGGSVASIAPAGLLELPDVLNLDFSKWKIYFCDERYVELSHSDSNYNAVNQNFISKVKGILKQNIYTINPNLSLEEARKDYEDKLKSSLDDGKSIDLLLIGMGPDGHICSLFPGHRLLDVSDCLVASIADSPKPPSCRITLTYAAVNSAKCALFIVAGSGKAVVAQKVLEENENNTIPAARVKLTSGTTHWFLDSDAASHLTQKK